MKLNDINYRKLYGILTIVFIVIYFIMVFIEVYLVSINVGANIAARYVSLNTFMKNALFFCAYRYAQIRKGEKPFLLKIVWILIALYYITSIIGLIFPFSEYPFASLNT